MTVNKPRYEERLMGYPFSGYTGVWDNVTRRWATWGDGYTVPMRFKTRTAAAVTAWFRNNGVAKV